MLIDAIVLAGGRSSRLDPVAKAELRYRQQSLVERTVAVVSGTQREPLAAIYASARLAAAIDAQRRAATLDGLSMFALIGELVLSETLVPHGATDDIYTWADAERFG